MPVIFDWRAAAPDELARQAAQAIAAGALAALPSEAGYVLAIDPAALTGSPRPSGLPDSLETIRYDGFADPREFFVRVPLTPAERSLIGRLWPGPVGIVGDDWPHPAWAPSHLAASTVLAHCQRPIALFETACDLPELGEWIDLAITDGPPRSGRLTLLRPNDTRWSIERPGLLSDADIRAKLARKIVFLCTGNTCRSPMAEGLFKRSLAERLGCEVSELADRGYLVSSAGLSAGTDEAAAADSIAVLREFGLDLSGHRSRPTTFDLIAEADDLIVMTRGHLQLLVARYPAFNGSLRMLCGSEGDLDDPIGRGSEVYRMCADVVQQHVERLTWEMGLS